MFGWLANAWRVPELRRRVLFTAGVLAVYRFGSWIPAPGVDQAALQSLFSGGGILSLLNLFSGSALSRFSLFALGIMPYVTASIIVQLLTVVIPTLERLQKEGEAGYAKINQYTRYLTVVLAAAQATGYAFLFKRQNALPNVNAGRLVIIILTLTAGCTEALITSWMYQGPNDFTSPWDTAADRPGRRPGAVRSRRTPRATAKAPEDSPWSWNPVRCPGSQLSSHTSWSSSEVSR